MNKVVIVSLALTGCTTLDEQVDVYVVSAAISPQPSAPDSLANVELTLHVAARSRADHEIALDRAVLDRPNAELETDLALQPFTPFWIHADESEEMTLANLGTTNAELAWLCAVAPPGPADPTGATDGSASGGGTASLFVSINYLDTLTETGGVEGNWTQTQAAVTCR